MWVVARCVGYADDLVFCEFTSDEILDQTLTCRTEPSHRRFTTHVLETEILTTRGEVVVDHERRGPTDFVLPTNAAARLLLIWLAQPTIPVRHVMDCVAEADLDGLARPNALLADGAL